MIRKIIGIAVCFTFITTAISAQGLGIELTGGLQGMQYQLQNGKAKPMPGGSLGLNYTFWMSSHLGLLTGITGGLYRTQASLQDGVVYTSTQIDDAGSAFQYSMKTEGYKETQQFFAATIPLLLQYHTAGTGTQWYFDGGGKIFIPFNTSIQISAEKLILSGYYPDFNVDVSNLPQHGFGTINSWKASATTKLKPTVALSAATGLSFSLSPGTRLYTGLYIDYGLSSLSQMNDSIPLINYSSKGLNEIHAGSVLNGSNAIKVGLFSFGLQVRLSFGDNAQKSSTRHNKKNEQQHPTDSTHSHEIAEAIQRTVVFGIVGKTTIPEIEKIQLDDVANILNQHPEIRISIVGHTCNSGEETEKINVGSTRAKVVARYLRDKGIARNRMDVTFASERDPDHIYDPAANYRNRRVVITVK